VPHCKANDRYAALMPSKSSPAAKLPRDLAALATDPRFDLHDGRFHEVTVDTRAQAVTMVINCGDLQVGYRRLTLSFDRATVVPDDLSRLADAVSAEFRANHWHTGRTVSEIQRQEVGVLPDGRYVLRLRLWPFYKFAIEFSGFSLVEIPMSARAPARAGRFTVDRS
jgi:hypothetical protein